MPKKFWIFFQVYTVAAATIIFLGSLLLLTGTIRTANLIIITPLTVMAWISFTNPKKASESIWSLRILIVVFCLTLLGLFAFQLSFWPKNQPECPVCPMASPAPSLPPPANLPSPAATASTDFILGSVTITGQNPAKIYAEPNLNSQILDTADHNNTYPYLEFTDGFFKIIFSATQNGWVRLEDVIP